MGCTMAQHERGHQLLQEVPSIRFRAAKPNEHDPVLEARTLVAQRIAVDVHDRVLQLQKRGVLPSTGVAAW